MSTKADFMKSLQKKGTLSADSETIVTPTPEPAKATTTATTVAKAEAATKVEDAGIVAAPMGFARPTGGDAYLEEFMNSGFDHTRDKIVGTLDAICGPGTRVTALQAIAILTKAAKQLVEAAADLDEEGSAEFNARTSRTEDKQLVIAGGVFSRNVGQTRWTYSPAVKALQEKEKAEKIATSTVSTVKKAFKVSVNA